MNTELQEALEMLEKEKSISRETLLEVIENSLAKACKNHYGGAENIQAVLNRDTCKFQVYAEKEVVKRVEDAALQITLAKAKKVKEDAQIGDTVQVPLESENFGRIVIQNARGMILQKIREEENRTIFDQFKGKERSLISGVVQRYVGKNISISFGKSEALLVENEQVPGERFVPHDRIKLYVTEVRENGGKGPRIMISRKNPGLVRCLFEEEVTEIKDGVVVIESLAREAGSRTKMAVRSNDENVDPLGACVGVNSARVNAVVEELQGEKVDIVSWDENPALFIENALSPAKVIAVAADPEEKTANVIVPDYQLSLAIGKEGQNARLAARLTGYKIDIKSESQAIENGDLPEDYMEQMELLEEDGDGYVGEYEQE